MPLRTSNTVMDRVTAELDKRLGPAPAGDLEETLAERSSINKRIRELCKLEQDHNAQTQLAKKHRTNSSGPRSECSDGRMSEDICAPELHEDGAQRNNLLDDEELLGERDLKLNILESISTAATTTEAGSIVDSPTSSSRCTDASDASTEDPRPAKESVIDNLLRHVDAVAVHDTKGRFLRWAPVTMSELCGHPMPPRNKLCNQNAGDCAIHRRCEIRVMEREEDAACIADRGYCGAIPRNGRNPCDRPKGRCPYHAEERVQCRSAKDLDAGARCWNTRLGASEFCEWHKERPDRCLKMKELFQERDGKPVTEDVFRAWDKVRFPGVAVLPIDDFPSFISGCAKACGFEIDDADLRARRSQATHCQNFLGVVSEVGDDTKLMSNVSSAHSWSSNTELSS